MTATADTPAPAASSPDADPPVRYVDADPCPRCGFAHATLEARRFNRPVVHSAEVSYNYWARCPGTDEPILFAFGKYDRG